MPKRIFLHVGSPKTGTTFLQNVLWSQRRTANDQGLLLPLASFHDHFLASADVREISHLPNFPERATGIWGRLVEEGSAWSGNVLVSHELFAATTSEQAQRAVEAWGSADVHVILTARDLVRQIPAEWQEHIKHRSSSTFGEFVEGLRTNADSAEWFWSVQDYADVCRRWGSAVPMSHIHVITVPPRRVSRDELWLRFARLVELDPDSFDLVSSRTNSSLRAEQAELLRRVNLGLGERLPIPGPYPPTVKEVFAQDVLAGRPGIHVALTGDDRAFAVQRSREIAEQLDALGVTVVGDLAELVPAEEPPDPAEVTDHPESLDDAILLSESIEAVDGLLVHVSKERQKLHESVVEQRRLHREVEELRAELGPLRDMRPDYERILHDMRFRPVHHFVIGLSERHTWVLKIRVGYWRTVNAGRWVRRLGRSPKERN